MKFKWRYAYRRSSRFFNGNGPYDNPLSAPWGIWEVGNGELWVLVFISACSIRRHSQYRRRHGLRHNSGVPDGNCLMWFRKGYFGKDFPWTWFRVVGKWKIGCFYSVCSTEWRKNRVSSAGHLANRVADQSFARLFQWCVC